MADQGSSTSSSSEYSDERAARPAPGTNEYFNEMIYCTCKRCQNRKLKKRRLVGIHRLNYGVYIEELLLVPNILEEPMDVTDDSHSQDEEQDTFMDETTSQINEAGVNEFTMMVHEGISRVSPPRMHLVGMQEPIMPSDTPNVMQKVHQFQNEASEEDLKYALLHGSQGLRQHMLDQGEKLVIGHEFEEAQQSNSLGSEHEEELEEHDELFVAHNDSIVILGPRQETILEFQQVGDKNNEEGVQCDEQSTPTIRIVPRRKRTQRKRMDRNK